ncbi:MAG TPA: glycosyltransferase family 39 protein [Blastocatellia bacterium]|nr:glycosyltransferase family 39 protein [Blastocatellia bacterium]
MINLDNGRLAIKKRILAFRRWTVGAMAARQRITPRAKLIIALSIFLLAFAVRSLHAVDLAPQMYTSEQPFNGLTENYDLRAVSITNGEGLLGPYNIDPSDTRWLGQAPGYSIFLSAVYSTLGRNFFTAQLVHNILNSFSAVLIFLIAGSLISWRVGGLSGILAALSHHLAHISNFILPDALCALPILAAIYLLVASRRARHTYLLYAAAGAMIGLASWLRAQAMLMGLFFAAMIFIISARRLSVLKRGLVMAMISLAAIAPITIRNYAVYGEFLPIQIGTGLNLCEGIADASGDRFGAVKTDMEVARQEADFYNDPRYAQSWTAPDGIKRDRDRTRRSLEIIFSHPLWYAGVMLDRCGEMLKYSAHAPLVYRIEEAKAAQRVLPVKRNWRSISSDESALAVGRSIFWLRPVVRAMQRITKETMTPFIIIGAVILFIVSLRRALFISIVPLYYFLFQSAMHTEFRYTLPMQYFVFVFAAVLWVLIGAGISRGIKRAFNSPSLAETPQAQSAAEASRITHY